MGTTTLIILSLYLAFSVGMGMFSVTQLGYQNRETILQQIWKVPFVFIKGFLGWVFLFPYGLKNSKYTFKVIHKVGRGLNER